ncbi:SANT/Myb_domain [Hexamita inflata]|uniref:SANT/Myb domain n=1 Tax=Hexamita inflata TaxID=28002 RepID=A0AA86UAB8_9EUKA|nr:SANT/Myb domain [Hexamita inflata]
MQNDTENIFLQQAATTLRAQFPQQYSNTDGTSVASQILLLTDRQYTSFWNEFSNRVNLPANELQQYFANTVASKFLTNPASYMTLPPLPSIFPMNQLNNNTQINTVNYNTNTNFTQVNPMNIMNISNIKNQPVQELNPTPNPFLATTTQQYFRKSVPRQKSIVFDQFSKLFGLALAQTLQFFTGTLYTEDSQLCQAVNSYLEYNTKHKFWSKMTELIPGKSNKQVQDYYAHSFQKVLFTKQLTIEDKMLIRKLNEELINEKPSYVSQMFMNSVKSEEYFKHNIIMYIINLRRQDKK